MQVDKNELRDMLLWLFENMEKVETDLIAHQLAFVFLKATGEFPELDEFLEKARSTVAPKLREKYRGISEAITKTYDEEDANQQVFLKIARNWKPTGPVN